MDQCKRTQHKWSFRTNRTEEQSLEIVRAGVRKQTEYDGDGVETAKAKMMQTKGPAFPIRRCGPAPREDPGGRRRTPEEVRAQRDSDRRHRDRVRLGREEIHGASRADAGSFERKLQNRREQSSRIHGAARDKEGEAHGELDDDALYGGGGGDYRSALARERARRERREARKATRTEELLAKEEAKRKAMMDMLGLSGLDGKKIEIAPRNDS